MGSLGANWTEENRFILIELGLCVVNQVLRNDWCNWNKNGKINDCWKFAVQVSSQL